MQFDQATNGNFWYEEFVTFIELDKLVSGTSITKKCSLFSGTNIKVPLYMYRCTHTELKLNQF